jgi:hypothetical protein
MILKAREGQIIEAGFNFHERPVLEFETLAEDAADDEENVPLDGEFAVSD